MILASIILGTTLMFNTAIAFAACSSTTFTVDGKTTYCTTCCAFGNCTTTCM